jgi:hypothetical protein
VSESPCHPARCTCGLVFGISRAILSLQVKPLCSGALRRRRLDCTERRRLVHVDIITFYGMAVLWESKTMPVIAKSTCAGEYRGTQGARASSDFGAPARPLLLLSDNQST